MVRTQIQITEEQASKLRAMSEARGVSIAQLIRTSIDDFVRREDGSSRDQIIARAKAIVGRFSSSHTDIAVNHDKYLAEDFDSR